MNKKKHRIILVEDSADLGYLLSEYCQWNKCLKKFGSQQV